MSHEHNPVYGGGGTVVCGKCGLDITMMDKQARCSISDDPSWQYKFAVGDLITTDHDGHVRMFEITECGNNGLVIYGVKEQQPSTGKGATYINKEWLEEHGKIAGATVTTEGRKDDADKPPYHLIAPELNTALAEILAFGAKKYSPRNWEKGMAWHRPFRACIGHMWDWWRDAGPDSETGKSHLWHAACCIMFLIAYEARGIGEDDRPKD